MNKYNSHDIILNVKNVSFSYFKGINKTEVLNNISFDLNKGEMVALVGDQALQLQPTLGSMICQVGGRGDVNTFNLQN